MNERPHTSIKWRIPRGYLAENRRDDRARERNSLAEAAYDLLWTPMEGEALLAEVREEWGECTEDELATALRRLRRAGHVRRRHGEYARTRSA
jgi:hypothetical protein